MTKLLFLDLETTGLDADLDPILEVGVILYDLKEAREIATLHAFPAQGENIRFRAGINPFVYKMHIENGLFVAISKAEQGPDLTTIGRSIIDMITGAGFWKGECMMAGRTPSFDRRFLAVHVPELDAFLSHRMIDVSTLTQLTKAWGPEKAEDPTKKNDPHRALEDCREAIKMLLKYRPVFAIFDLYPELPNKPPA